MRDIFSEGLLYLDLLEIYGSSYAVADLCGVAQSNVFRGASACSKLLNLGLTKDRAAGTYRIERNHDVQRDLRRLNQRLRGRENGQLRAVGPDYLFPAVLPRSQAGLLRQLPIRWDDPLQSVDFLERGLLDLVAVNAAALSGRISWPPPVRRRDLFVPCDGLMVSELSPLPLVLWSAADHTPDLEQLLQQLGADQLFATPCLAGLQQQPQLALPAFELLPGTEDLSTTVSAVAQQKQTVYLLSSLHELEPILAVEDGPWHPHLLAPVHDSELLLLTLSSLIAEPLHQQLVSILRNQARDRLHSAKSALTSSLRTHQ